MRERERASMWNAHRPVHTVGLWKGEGEREGPKWPPLLLISSPLLLSPPLFLPVSSHAPFYLPAHPFPHSLPPSPRWLLAVIAYWRGTGVGGDSTQAVVRPRWVTLALSIGRRSVADVARVGNTWGGGYRGCSCRRFNGVHVVTWHACGWGRSGGGDGSYAFGWWLSSGLGVPTWHPNELWMGVRRSESSWGGWGLPIRV